MKNPVEKYIRRFDFYERISEKRSKKINSISNARLFSFIAATAGALTFYFLKLYIVSAALFAGFAALFIYLVILHEKLINSRNYYIKVREINERSVKRIKHDWYGFNDKGDEFVSKDHPYSTDLDIFGKGSLFQWTSTAHTFLGRVRLSNILTSEPDDIQSITRRQTAIKELAEKFAWRQRFEAESMIEEDIAGDPSPLLEWAENKKDRFFNNKVVAGITILPVLTIALVLMFLLGYVPYFLPLILIAFQAIILKVYSEKFKKVFNTASKYKENVSVYYRMLRLIELRKFDSEYLKNLKSRLTKDGKPAYEQINQLYKITDAISNRANMAYFIFDVITLWDFHTLNSLENWKKDNGEKIRVWLEVIAEFEMLSSLALIRHDNPDWAMPEFSLDRNNLAAKKMGHPLLPSDRVCNDLKTGSSEQVLLITGSNMSGKSTLLRTAGINLVLAYSGAPVCAASFNCSIMNVYSCMRVNDNLEDNISSFYAEILRIKLIIDAVKAGKKVFFLLDEIFRGTNSSDRHTGARVLVNMLAGKGAGGLVSTHDLELAGMEEDNGGRIRNYHFEEYYKNNELSFDYKLRRGISTTRNAIYLMKLAGIDFEEKKEEGR